ncbi:hypothetical protein BC827DRAFT_70089 [Russula dissimulans]|nr:hypothetical protein BC827DRAFT_70089 [Russula dissimulans]
MTRIEMVTLLEALCSRATPYSCTRAQYAYPGLSISFVTGCCKENLGPALGSARQNARHAQRTSPTLQIRTNTLLPRYRDLIPQRCQQNRLRQRPPAQDKTLRHQNSPLSHSLLDVIPLVLYIASCRWPCDYCMLISLRYPPTLTLATFVFPFFFTLYIHTTLKNNIQGCTSPALAYTPLLRCRRRDPFSLPTKLNNRYSKCI